MKTNQIKAGITALLAAAALTFGAAGCRQNTGSNSDTGSGSSTSGTNGSGTSGTSGTGSGGSTTSGGSGGS